MGDSSDDDDDDGGSEHSAASSEEEQRDSDDSDSEEETGGDRPAELEHVLRQGDMQILEREEMLRGEKIKARKARNAQLRAARPAAKEKTDAALQSEVQIPRLWRKSEFAVRTICHIISRTICHIISPPSSGRRDSHRGETPTRETPTRALWGGCAVFFASH